MKRPPLADSWTITLPYNVLPHIRIIFEKLQKPYIRSALPPFMLLSGMHCLDVCVFFFLQTKIKHRGTNESEQDETLTELPFKLVAGV